MRRDRINPSKKGPVIKADSLKRRKDKVRAPVVIVGRNPEDPIIYSQAVQKQVHYFIEKYNLRCPITRFEGYASWVSLSMEEFLSDEFRDTFAHRLNWSIMCANQDLSERCMERHASRLDWRAVSRRQKMSRDFILKHCDQLDIGILQERGLITPEQLKDLVESDIVTERFELLDFEWKGEYMGAEIRNEKELHGRRVELIRGGKKVRGIILAQDLKFSSCEFLFQWKDEQGRQSMSPLLDGELEQIRGGGPQPETVDE